MHFRYKPICVLLTFAVSGIGILACQNSTLPTDQKTPTEPCLIHFEDATATAGIDFLHFGDKRSSILPEDNGSGVAIGDYDNDGYDDIYLVNFAGPALMPREELIRTRRGGRLFRNTGNGTFSDVTETANLVHIGWDMAAVWADLDSDGWLDLLITGINEVALYRNQGDGTFIHQSEDAGLGYLNCFASGPTIGDYDVDGDLDVYVPCYVDFPWERAHKRPSVGGRPAPMTTPADYPPQRNFLFKNNGKAQFLDDAKHANVLDSSGRGLQAIFADLDDDLWPDLYVSNDQSFDRLFLNKKDGTFENLSPTAGTNDPRAGMGIGIGDYNADGLIDLFLTHWVGEQNALYLNRSTTGRLLFEDRTLEERLAPIDLDLVGWATGFFDFELDGDLDILVVNGSTIEDEWTLDVLSDPKMIPQPLHLYERLNNHYTNASACAGEPFTLGLVGRGGAFTDYDRDGLIDAVISTHNGPPLLLHNTSSTEGHWLQIELVGQGQNKWAIGAKVSVHTEFGSLVRTRLAGESYLSANSSRLHFGLGSIETGFDVEVQWPSGETTRIKNIPIDRIIRLRQGTDTWEEVPVQPSAPRPWGQ